jgi:hypothetical protein
MISEEISNLQSRLKNKDHEFYEILRREEVGKIVDSFTDMRYQSSNYISMTFKVKEIGKIVKQKTFDDLELIKDEKYSVENEDKCLDIIKQ